MCAHYCFNAAPLGGLLSWANRARGSAAHPAGVSGVE